jgi:hypothetical protein
MTRRTFYLLLTVAAALCLTAGRCAEKTDEGEERQLCDELSQSLCAKWFDCWPVISAEWWGDVEDCEDIVFANCSNSEALYECDLDNADLEECADGVEGSACGSLPSSCHDFVECE